MCAMDVATVGRKAEGLRFSDVERGPDGAIEFAWARLRVRGLDASLRISAHYATGFAASWRDRRRPARIRSGWLPVNGSG